MVGTIISAITAIVGTGVAVYGQQQAAQAAEYTGQYNAKLQRQQAKQETAAAAENARRKTRDNARILAAQRAALAESGFAMEGTPLAVLGETAMTLQRDILDIGYEAANRSRSLIAGANMSQWQGGQQASSTRLGAAATGLGGVSSAFLGFRDSAGLNAPKLTKA